MRPPRFAAEYHVQNPDVDPFYGRFNEAAAFRGGIPNFT